MQEETLTEINDFLLKQNNTVSSKNGQKYKILALTDFPLGIIK